MTRTIQNDIFLQITCTIKLGIAVVKKRMDHIIISQLFKIDSDIIGNNFAFYIISDSSLVIANMMTTRNLHSC